jgi:hypothetical protein
MVFTAILLDWGAFKLSVVQGRCQQNPRETCVSSRLSTFEVIGVPSEHAAAVERA